MNISELFILKNQKGPSLRYRPLKRYQVVQTIIITLIPFFWKIHNFPSFFRLHNFSFKNCCWKANFFDSIRTASNADHRNKPILKFGLSFEILSSFSTHRSVELNGTMETVIWTNQELFGKRQIYLNDTVQFQITENELYSLRYISSIFHLNSHFFNQEKYLIAVTSRDVHPLPFSLSLPSISTRSVYNWPNNQPRAFFLI